jgi:two-component system, OmpR family, KDP operon response regulator KdpE
MSDPKPVILCIEDDPQIRRFLRTGLGSQGFEFLEAETGRQGISEAAARNPDLVILDLGLPDLEGVEVVQRLREWTSLPILILSARSLEGEKIAALDAGADDYLTKPFGMGELLARIRVALRHAAGTGKDGDSVFSVANLRVDLARRQVLLNERAVHLTPLEYRLLSALVKHAGMVLTHRQLLKEVWGPNHVEDSHYLRIYMAQLRHKLEADPAQPRFLLTEVGVGYRLALE